MGTTFDSIAVSASYEDLSELLSRLSAVPGDLTDSCLLTPFLFAAPQTKKESGDRSQ